MILLHLCSYELSSGYRPAPLDLSHIKLTLTQEAMVDKLAENAHNAWAKDRIRQGWTYGIQQVWVKNMMNFKIQNSFLDEWNDGRMNRLTGFH